MKKPKNFEEGMLRLDEILLKISDENTALTEAVSLYADAASLLAYCNETLSSAKLQIEEIDSRLNATKIEDDIL